jgi:hypothetical protein
LEDGDHFSKPVGAWIFGARASSSAMKRPPDDEGQLAELSRPKQERLGPGETRAGD